MPDHLYDRDILEWSQQQADLIRRCARGEEVEIDWVNVIDEIETFGRMELHAVRDRALTIIVRLLNLYVWPDDAYGPRWGAETVRCQHEAQRRITPSMHQRLDVKDLFTSAVEIVRAGDPAIHLPPENPYTLDQLLTEDIDSLLARLPPTP